MSYPEQMNQSEDSISPVLSDASTVPEHPTEEMADKNHVKPDPVTSKPPHAEKFLKTFCSNNISINDTSSYANIVLNIKRLSIDLLF